MRNEGYAYSPYYSYRAQDTKEKPAYLFRGRNLTQILCGIIGRDNNTEVTSGAIRISMARGAAGLLVFVTELFLARILREQQYGIYVCALSWVTVLALVSRGERYVVVYKANRQWELLRGYF